MWKVIFTGAICLVVAVGLAAAAVALSADWPWVSATFALVDVGVVLAGLKTVLAITKTANELRKMDLEIRKLQMEIEEKKRAAQKEGSYIVVATLDEITRYTPSPAGSRRSSRVGLPTIAMSLLVVAGGGALLSISLLTRKGPTVEPAMPNPSGQLSEHYTCGGIGELELSMHRLSLQPHGRENENIGQAVAVVTFSGSTPTKFILRRTSSGNFNTDEPVTFLDQPGLSIESIRIEYDNQTASCVLDSSSRR